MWIKSWWLQVKRKHNHQHFSRVLFLQNGWDKLWVRGIFASASFHWAVRRCDHCPHSRRQTTVNRNQHMTVSSWQQTRATSPLQTDWLNKWGIHIAFCISELWVSVVWSSVSLLQFRLSCLYFTVYWSRSAAPSDTTTVNLSHWLCVILKVLPAELWEDLTVRQQHVYHQYHFYTKISTYTWVNLLNIADFFCVSHLSPRMCQKTREQLKAADHERHQTSAGGRLNFRLRHLAFFLSLLVFAFFKNVLIVC